MENSLNATLASREAHVLPDLKRIAKYDPHPKKNRREKTKYIVIMVCTIMIAVFFAAVGFYWWALLPLTVFLFYLWMFKLVHNIKPDTPYRSGLLVPAVITRVKPLTLAAVADVSLKEEVTVPAVRFHEIKELPDTEMKPGTRVLCTALFGGPMPFAGVYSQMDLFPLVWATDDRKQLETAGEQINEEEWQRLERLATEGSKHKNSEKNKFVYFTPSGEFDEEKNNI